jgi:hypothetical protein
MFHQLGGTQVHTLEGVVRTHSRCERSVGPTLCDTVPMHHVVHLPIVTSFVPNFPCNYTNLETYIYNRLNPDLFLVGKRLVKVTVPVRHVRE